MNLQDRIDGMEYPPTHNYTLETLEPHGSLKLRLFRMPKEFFDTGESFLDIGSSKGFFSLYSKARDKEALEPRKDYADLCNELGIKTLCTTFRNFSPVRKYDRIMIGNAIHYLFRESKGWDFIVKLAAISTDLVLIEGPTGMNCLGMKDAIPKYLRGRFTDEKFRTRMNQFFELVDQQKSPSQGRLIMLWKRRPNRIRIFDTTNATVLKDDNESTIYDAGDDIIKIQKNNSVYDEIRYFIAAHSPISNGFISLIYNGGFRGWAEKKSTLKKIPKLTRQGECLKQLARHNVYLTRLGYTEMDMSISNFFEDLTFYDKGGVWTINELQEGAILDRYEGWFFKMFRQSFTIPIDWTELYRVMNSRDPEKIENFYLELLQEEKFENEKFSLKNTIRNKLSGKGLGRFRR